MRIFLALSLLFAAAAGHCCGPFFHPAYLNGKDFENQPLTNINYELDALGRHFFPADAKFPRIKLPREEAVKQDVLEACRANAIKDEDARRFLKDLADLRQRALQGDRAATFKYPPALAEFVLYEQGVADLASNPYNPAPQPWLDLLRLPGAQRHYRTTWTLYLLGNLKPNSDYHQKLRESTGFKDSLGLAYDSFKTDYRNAPELKDKLRLALRCYHLYRKLEGQSDAEQVMRDIVALAEQYHNQTEEDKLKVLSDPVAKEVALLVVSSRHEEELSTLEKFHVDKFLGAERLAWRAYSKGNKELCRKYLNMAPDDSMVKLWLLARFARQEGNFAKSAELLRKWLVLYGNRQDAPVRFNDEFHDNRSSSMKQDVLCLLGSALVGTSEADLPEALNAFMLANDDVDAACVAEQLMPVAKLVEYCRIHAPTHPAELGELDLRPLLARRLMRERRPNEALEFFPPAVRPLAELHCRLSKQANDFALGREERASALLKLGMLAKKHGDALFSTTLQPDYMLNDNDYDYCDLDKLWPTFYQEHGVGPRLLPLPTKHYHYRYLAANYFTRAAALSGKLETKTLAYYLAGDALRHRNPQAANLYYQMLCDCQPHPLAVHAALKRWFPDTLPPDVDKLRAELLSSLAAEAAGF